MNEYVFISYKSEQKSIALKIKTILEENGITCWMAPESIPGGSNYAAEITQAISQCKEFVVILSEQSQNSAYVLKEIDVAIKKNKNILPFQVEPIVLNDSIEYYFSNVQMYSAHLSWESALEKLIREIRYNFESINAQRTPDTILNDPVKIRSALPHVFEEGYLLFGRYRIEKLLQVCMGNQQHYSALDSHTNRRMLVKYIDRTLPYQEMGFGISTAGALFQHPYIAAPVDEYSNESYFIHIEPFYEVVSLDQIISRNGPQMPRDVQKWATAVCHAMIYLNEDMGYGYCYMASQNIRIQKNGIPILFDVSVAVPLGSPASHLGLEYLPPEAITSKAVAKPTVDIYSLGTNIYYALTGRSYYQDLMTEGPAESLNRPEIPEGFRMVLQRCLKLSPDSRYQSFREVLQDLERVEELKPQPQRQPEKKSFLRKLFQKK